MLRTQLYLDEAIHRRLDAEGQERTLRAIEGLWRDRDDIRDSSTYVRRLRRDTHRLRPRR